MALACRSKDVIKSGGEWISSVIIENTTLSHPEVCQAQIPYKAMYASSQQLIPCPMHNDIVCKSADDASIIGWQCGLAQRHTFKTCYAVSQVFEAAVIAKPHKKWLERPLLIIVAEPGKRPTKDSILKFLKVSDIL